MLWQVEVQSIEAGRHEGNLLYLLHVYCDSLSRLLEKHGFQSFGKYERTFAMPPCTQPSHVLAPRPTPSPFVAPLETLLCCSEVPPQI